MSVIVKGMEMPKYPTAIRIQIEADGSVYQNSDKTGNGWALQKNVTATEVPPHGDLIDRDKASERFAELSENIETKLGFECSASYTLASLFLQNKGEFPTIIEAEEGE